MISREAFIAAAAEWFMATDEDHMPVCADMPIDNSPFRLSVDPRVAGGLIVKRADWNKVTPFLIETERLTMRPAEADDIVAFHAIAGQSSVARMLVNLEHPLSETAASDWLSRRQFRGRLGFMVGVYDKEGTMLGAIGLGGISTALVYFIDENRRGYGIGTEAVGAFLRYTRSRFALKSIFAGVFVDNPASRHLLEREGFIVVGTKPFQSPARAEPSMIWEMQWDRA
ncbi:GNAT family N-acetyltransferase (plasmid) [Rhodopseudomonas palustris]